LPAAQGEHTTSVVAVPAVEGAEPASHDFQMAQALAPAAPAQ